jgi:glycerol kinase
MAGIDERRIGRNIGSNDYNDGLYFVPLPLLDSLLHTGARTPGAHCVGMTATHHKGTFAAALEAAAYQTREVFEAGDATRTSTSNSMWTADYDNKFLTMQFRNRHYQCSVVKAGGHETTAMPPSLQVPFPAVEGLDE